MPERMGAPDLGVSAMTVAPQRAEAPGSRLGAGSAPAMRPYQLAADLAIDREHARVRSTLLVMATGTGKTVVFTERVRRCKMLGGRALVLAHRDELIQQPRRKLEALGIV